MRGGNQLKTPEMIFCYTLIFYCMPRVAKCCRYDLLCVDNDIDE